MPPVHSGLIQHPNYRCRDSDQHGQHGEDVPWRDLGEQRQADLDGPENGGQQRKFDRPRSVEQVSPVASELHRALAISNPTATISATSIASALVTTLPPKQCACGTAPDS